MLRELHVRNLAVLASASVEFGRGLNVLTGETGAGKSIVVDSLNLLAGGRASSELIRTGADTLTVSGTFEPSSGGWKAVLEEAGLEADGDELLVRREVSRNGRNRVFLNDQPATLRLLASLAPLLLRIHGQREELDLLTPELQRAWLDRSGGAEAEGLLAGVAQAYEAHAGLAARLESLEGGEKARAERIDYLRFQASEIDAAELVAGEEDALRAEREQLRHLEAIREGLTRAVALLHEDEDAAVDRLAKAEGLLAGIADWQKEAEGWCAELDELRIRSEEVAATLGRRLAGLEADPGRLDAVEDRLAVLERLCRKYGRPTAEILELRAALASELEALEGDADDLGELEAKAAEALAGYRKEAEELSAARARWGQALVAEVSAQLGELGLGRARLEVELGRRRLAESPLEVNGERIELGPAGFDQVSFLFAPNPGERAQALSRIASGGELSRVSLALQLAARGAEDSGSPTLVFDEVDTGIGGAEAAAVGAKLQRLAGRGQILAVTHLPQVASFGDRHHRVSKRVEGGRTHAEVEALEPGSREREIARMLAGSEITDTSLSHARELIANAAEAPAEETPPAKSRATTKGRTSAERRSRRGKK